MSRTDASSVARSVTGHPYRRILLSVLDSQQKPVSVRDLSRAILAFDRSGETCLPALDTSAVDDDIGPSGVETMAAQLHHVHVPRLASAGLVEYDADARLVVDWYHPAVGDRWLTAPPLDRLAGIIADSRATTLQAD